MGFEIFIVGIIVVAVAVISSINKNKPLCDKCNVILVSLDTYTSHAMDMNEIRPQIYAPMPIKTLLF